MSIEMNTEQEPKLETNRLANNISKKLAISMLFVVWLIVVWLISFCLDMILLYQSKENIKQIMLPFIFMGIIFIAALIGTDSILKTIKYNYRAKESVLGNIIQSISLAGLAALAWWNSK